MTKGQLTGRIVVAAVLAAAVAWTLVNRDRIDADALEGWIQGFGIWGPALFIGLYALATVLFLPGSIFSLAGGLGSLNEPECTQRVRSTVDDSSYS